MKVGSFEVPDFRLIPNTLNILEEIYHTKHQDRVQSKQLSILLGYKYGTESHFYRRLRSLLEYGLLEGSGTYQVSELGEKILHSRTEQEKELCKTRAVLNVSLWKAIYDKHGKTPRQDNFWAVLNDIAKISPDKAKELESKLYKWYTEDIAHLNEDLVKANLSDQYIKSKPLRSSDAQNQLMSQQILNPSLGIIPNNFEKLEFGKTTLVLPRKDLKKEWEKLQKHMKIFLEDYDFKEKSESPQETDINANSELAE